jgi:hypothetical protein
MSVRCPLWRVAVVAAAAVVAGACSSSTGPGGPTAAQSAEQIDSIYSALLANGGDTSYGAAFASAIVAFVEPAAAYGAAPTSFNVTTASGTQTWQGSMIASTISGDTVFLTTLYPANSNLLNLVVTGAEYDSIGTMESFAFILYDSAGVEAYHGATAATVSTTPQSFGRSCHLQAGLAADSVFPRVFSWATGCQELTATYSATVQFTAPAPAMYSSLTISNVTVNGVLFYGNLYAPDQIPRGPTIASARIRALVDMVRQRH